MMPIRKQRHRRVVLPLAMALTLGVVVGPGMTRAPAAASTGVVLEWNQIASDTLVAATPTLVYELHQAMVHGAIYDAVNAIDGGHRPYLVAPPAEPWFSEGAAAATAAFSVLAHLVPSQAEALEDRYEVTLEGIPDGAAEDGGIAVGRAAADAMIRARANDGRFGTPGFATGTAPGVWRPVLPLFVNDPVAWIRDVDPFLIPDASRFRTDGPNPITGRAYARDFAEVKSLGSATSTSRTAVQTEIARFWGGANGLLLWNSMFRTLAMDQELSDVDNARLFAMLYLTGADAAIACWDDKGHWSFWRPITAIREAALDGNPATTADPDWLPLLPTPPYPEHPSGLGCLTAAYARTLRDYFGSNTIAFGGRNPVNGIERSFDHFSDVLGEIVDARVWAGLHFRVADVQGTIIGKRVAQWRQQHAFGAV